jgi:replicative DNA helicase
MILVEHVNEIANLNYRESKHGMSNIEIAEAFYDGKITQSKKLPTTCDQLNDALEGGIMPKSLIIIAAGASVGKTGFSIYLLDCIARAHPGSESLFFSIEMEYDQIWMRHVGICAGKQFDKLTNDERLAAIAKTLEVPMKIYDTALCRATSDIDFILTTARLRAMEKPISVIVVDYLGLVQNKGNFERNDLKQSDITSKLAQLAIELNCIVIALSQINRGASNRGAEDRCPWPHDAADSSGGHRSSSLWLGVDRPELYQDDPCYRNQFVVKCRKNRFGNTFDLIFAFNEGTFAEVQSGWFRQPMKQPRNAEQALFSAHSKDFSEKQYID